MPVIQLMTGTNSGDKALSKVIDVTHHDGHPFSTGKSMTTDYRKIVANPGGGVMMQAFYWDVPAGGNWWNTVSTKVTAWSNAGIGSIGFLRCLRHKTAHFLWDMILLIILILETTIKMEL
jgi:hypothetical protein